MPKMIWSLLVVSVAAVSVAGCNQTPADKAADAIARSGHDRSEAIQSQAENQAKGLDQRATTLSGQAKQAGGYTGQRLNVQADALGREADIVRKQGKAQGEATREAADAQAKGIRSR
jgi:hypothetical protein